MNGTMNKCNLCKKTFGEKENGKHNRHKKLSHDFPCHNCTSMFVDDMELKTHLREKHGVRVDKVIGMNDFAYECRKCLKRSQNFGANIKHEQLEHLHKCEICIEREVAFPFSFINKNGLKRHKVNMHNGEMEGAILQKSSEEKGKDSDDSIQVVAVMPKLVKGKIAQHVHVKDEDLPIDYSDYIINESLSEDEEMNEVSPNDKIKKKSFLASKSNQNELIDENANKLAEAVSINQSKTVENAVQCNRERNAMTDEILCTTSSKPPLNFSQPVPKPPPNRSVLTISPMESISIPAIALPAFSDIHSEFDVMSEQGNLERIDEWVGSTLKEEAEVVPMEDPVDQNLRGNTEIKVVEVDGILMVQERYAVRINSATHPEARDVSPLGLQGDMLTSTQEKFYRHFDPLSAVSGREKSPLMGGLWNQNLCLINENPPAKLGPTGRGRARVRGGVKHCKIDEDNHTKPKKVMKVIIPNISKKLQHSVPVNGGIAANTRGADGGEVPYRSSLITSTLVAQAVGTPRETPSPSKVGAHPIAGTPMAGTSGMELTCPMRPGREVSPVLFSAREKGPAGGAPPHSAPGKMINKMMIRPPMRGQGEVRMRGTPGGFPKRRMRGNPGGPLVRGMRPRMPMGLGVPGIRGAIGGRKVIGPHVMGIRPSIPLGRDATGMQGEKLMSVPGAQRGTWPEGFIPGNPAPPVLKVNPTLNLRIDPTPNLRADPTPNLRAYPSPNLRADPTPNLRADPTLNLTVDSTPNPEKVKVEAADNLLHLNTLTSEQMYQLKLLGII